MQNTLLGGFSPTAFLRRFWQKRPLLVRAAIPGFCGLLNRRQLFELARRNDCESRLIIRNGREWHVEHGPLSARASRDLPSRDWTLLVQGINHFLPAARDLLGHFSFVPLARLDDLMVSYAPPGGGVGPHVDSYDVFLLQGHGRRRWRVGRQSDHVLEENAPLKLLKHFRAEGEADLDPGDMLYLPPGFAHDGIALTDCSTYSIGFRAPGFDELKTQFLAYLDDIIHLEGIYSDPGLRSQRHPGTIDDRMVDQIAKKLAGIRWNRTVVRDFLGTHLTEPKGHVRFESSARPVSLGSFKRAATHGVRLAPASLMLVHERNAFINGEAFRIPEPDHNTFVGLADRRCLKRSSGPFSTAGYALLYRWYRDGYLELN